MHKLGLRMARCFSCEMRNRIPNFNEAYVPYRTIVGKGDKTKEKPFKYGLKPGEKVEEFEEMAYKIHFVNIANLGYKMKLASLYMQATEGPNNTEEPEDDPYEHSYWKAWKQLGDMSKEDAKKEYVRFAKERMKKKDTQDIIIND